MRRVASASPTKLRTEASRSRRQTSLRLLRLREAAEVSQAEIGARVGVTKRAMGSIERAEVRMVALEAFFYMFDLVVEQQGVEAAVAALLTEEQRRALFDANTQRKAA